MKKLFSFLLITFGICFAFIFDRSSSYAMGSTMTIDYAMWNAYNIAAEYMCGRASRNLQNPYYSDITQISGINDPFSSSNQYGQLLWNASGNSTNFSQLDVWNAMISDAQTFDVSSMTSSELNDFLEKCGVVQSLVGENWLIKTTQLNGIRFYWATTKAGDWLGTSFANILAKFDELTPELESAIKNESSVLYPYSYDVYISDHGNFYYTSNGLKRIISISSTSDIFYFSENGYLKLFVPSDFNYNSISGYRYNIDENTYYYFNSFSWWGTPTTVNINGISYKYGSIYLNRVDSSSVLNAYCENNISSAQSIIDYISQYGYVGDTVESEIVDSQSVPYTVPEIGELATPITDIYPILESIRDGIISIPTTGELATVLYPSLADAIADAIEDAKTSSIAISDTQDPPPPNPDDDDDDKFDPVIGWVGDLMPDGMFTMFEPIFSIVPSNYSMYGFWISIPLIILVCIIIYFIVSVL